MPCLPSLLNPDLGCVPSAHWLRRAASWGWGTGPGFLRVGKVAAFSYQELPRMWTEFPPARPLPLKAVFVSELVTGTTTKELSSNTDPFLIL